jgi:hypothetical protein
LIENQFNYGGKKYGLASSNTRESTDVLFDSHSFKWLVGTIDKYCFRFRNLARERDLLKIACYQYILWLKRGFFIQSNGVSSPIDTNLEIKRKQYPVFSDKVEQYLNVYEKEINVAEDKITMISNILQTWSDTGWESIKENHIFQIFGFAFAIWRRKYANLEKHDQDINHPHDKK